jgi:NADH:ubiquinone oxidoreductase subunit 5 (subunit L)/multisubunit Na+/H+ antiporter MnhA subunit
VAGLAPPRAWAALLAVAGTALIGGLAVVAFAKAVGTAFLGSARSEGAAGAHEPPRTMLAPMLLLAGLCVAAGLAPGGPWRLLEPALAQLTAGLPPAAASSARALPTTLVWHLTLAGLLLAAGLLLLAALRRLLLQRRTVRTAPVWACGYAEPVPRAQYTGSSLVEPVAAFLEALLPSRNLAVRSARGLFPREAWVRIGTADIFRQRVYSPAFTWLRDTFARARRLQHGHLQWYLLYIFLTLIVLLVVEGVRR